MDSSELEAVSGIEPGTHFRMWQEYWLNSSQFPTGLTGCCSPAVATESRTAGQEVRIELSGMASLQCSCDVAIQVCDERLRYLQEA